MEDQAQMDQSPESPLMEDQAQMDPSPESPLMEDQAQMDPSPEPPLMEDQAQMDPTLELPLNPDPAERGPTDESPGYRDCKLDFAYDVFDEVFPWITGVDPPKLKTCPPVNPTFELTLKHKEYIRDFLEEEGSKLKKYVGEKRSEKPWEYTDETYKRVRNTIIKKYKEETYGEKSFVRLCAAVAFATIGNQSLREKLHVADEAPGELHEVICRVLKPGGDIVRSEWNNDEEFESGEIDDLEI